MSDNKTKVKLNQIEKNMSDKAALIFDKLSSDTGKLNFFTYFRFSTYYKFRFT